MIKDNWYEVKDPARIDSPAMLIFPDRVKANIRAAIAMVVDAERLRPYVETNKSPEAVKLMIEAGIYKFKCSIIAEAEMLGMVAAKDVLLTYQPIEPKLQRFIDHIKKYYATNFACITDNFSSAMEQSHAFAANDLTVPVYIDINTGMNRTGIQPGKEAIQLYLFLQSASGITAAGQFE